MTREVLAKFKETVTPALAEVQNTLKNLDSGFRRKDVQWLLQEAHLKTFLAHAVELCVKCPPLAMGKCSSASLAQCGELRADLTGAVGFERRLTEYSPVPVDHSGFRWENPQFKSVF